MTYEYGDRRVFLADLTELHADGFPLCGDHGDRLTPPLGWTLTDHRSLARLFAPLEVA
jgi:hypothetical protein